MRDFLEAVMIVCFGISWPINIAKAWKARTAKGTSVLFYSFIWIGYAAGITNKILGASVGAYQYNYVFFFYILNITMVTVGILVWFRNHRLDRDMKLCGQEAPI